MAWARASLLGVVLALGAPPAAASEGPRSSRVEASVVEGLRVETSARCGAQVRGELVEGQRRDGVCGEDREAIGRAVVRRRDAFGFVEQRAVDLASLRLVLGEARRCRQWPLRSPGRDVLRRTDAAAAGCRMRRYQGEVAVVLVDREGRRHEPLPPLRTDRDGRAELRFAVLDQALRVLGEGTLDGYARIELGEDGWAGHVDLEQLLRFRADWHLTWLLHGRGTPGLFAVRHPEHRGADEARTLAAEALLARQARDYDRVTTGELPARVFLDRYPSSPYRRRVESLLRERTRTTRLPEDQRGEGEVGGAASGEAGGGAAPGEAGGGAASGEAGGAPGVPEGPAGGASASSSSAGGGRSGGTSGGGGP